MPDRLVEQYELTSTWESHDGRPHHSTELSDSTRAMPPDHEFDDSGSDNGETAPFAPSSSTPPNSVVARRTVRKLDTLLLPFLSVLFLLNSLDRSNIGNAETAHFTRDTGLAPSDVNTAMACFFAFFVALQPLGAALGRRFGMGRWVPGVMVLWGICTAAHVAVTKKWQLIVLRIAIGCLEAGFYPTTVSYLSLFYTRYEFARRLGLFYGQYAVAGAVGGVISYFVFKAFPPDPDSLSPKDMPRDHAKLHLKSWQVLFLLEGILTIMVALVGLVWLPRGASTAWFLTPEERKWAEERIRLDRDSGDMDERPKDVSALDQTPYDDNEDEFRGHEPNEGLLASSSSSSHPKQSLTSDAGLPAHSLLSTILLTQIWFPLLILNILSSTPTLAFSIFLPLVLSHSGLPPTLSNLLTAPPFLCGAVTLYGVSYWSDRSRARLIPILVGLAVSVIGLAATLLLPTSAYVFRYIALCILLSASFIASPLTVAWLASNVPDPATRALVLGINGWGNLAGVLSSLLFAPRYADSGYRVPIMWTMGFVAVSGVGYVGFRWGLVRENEGRRRVLDTFERGMGEREAAGFEMWIRRVVGGRILGLSEEEWRRRRGGEKLTFRYGL
jgi:MFS family permease